MLEQLRRDVTMLMRGLAGRTPPPLVKRMERRAVAGRGVAVRMVVVETVARETAEAVSLTLRDPSGAELAFTPGQFFTLEATIDGERVRRAYSASGDARDRSRATITVKRVAGGRMSTFLCERAAAGMTLGVLGPSGDFALPAATAPRHVLAIAGGSGITPIMAIARATLAAEPTTTLTLVYANRNRAAIIFAGALEQLAAQHAGRLTIVHRLDDVDGELTAAALAALLPPDASDVLLCGPDPMMALARAALTARGIAADRVREERFFAPSRPTAATTAQALTIRRGGAITRAIVRPGDTLLDAGLAAGVPLKLSCAMGGCGACAVTLVDGEVTMDEPNCLTAAERAGGKVLACVARPTSPCTVEAPT